MDTKGEEISQEPSPKEGKPLLTLWRLIGLAALLSVIIAAGWWYYVKYFPVMCDRAASANVVRASAAIELLGSEVWDLDPGISIDEFADTLVADNVLRYLVGPYYGWRGSTRKCEVLLRFAKVDNGWRPQSVALRGSQPAGLNSRYVYSPERPSEIMYGIVDARDGKSEHWNSYPYRKSPDDSELCYTESVVAPAKKRVPGRAFVLRAPKGVPCDQIPESAFADIYRK